MFLSLFVLLSFFGVIHSQTPLKKESLTPNWDDFQKHSDTNKKELSKFIEDFPIHSYWDTLKGAYRTGALGDQVEGITLPNHLSLITVVDKHILQNGKLIKVRQPIVDHNLLFMVMLVAVQDLSQLSEFLLLQANGYEQQFDFKKILEHMKQQNTSSTADIDASLRIAQLEGKLLALKREVDQRRRAFAQLTETQQLSWKQQARTSLHQRLLQQMQESAETMNNLYKEKWTFLENKMLHDSNTDFDKQQREIEAEFNDSVRDLEEEIQISLAIIAYRAEEEQKALAFMDDIATRITSAQAETLQQGTEEVISVITTELSNTVKEIVQDPWFVWLWGRIILGVVVTVVVVIELSRSLHVLLYHWQRRSHRLYSQEQYLPSWWTAVFGSPSTSSLPLKLSSSSVSNVAKRLQSINTGDDVITLLEEESHLVFSRQPTTTLSDISTTNMASLVPRDKLLRVARDVFVAVDVHSHPYVQSYAQFAPHAATPMPNLLFFGPAGCGKSETARQLAHYISQDVRAGHFRHSGFIVLSGADLLALGDQAGQYISELFKKHGHSLQDESKHNATHAKTTMLIIDEADEIICTRDMMRTANAESSVRSAAERTQQNSSNLSQHELFSLPPEEETPSSQPVIASSTSILPPSPAASTAVRSIASPHHVLYSLLEGLRVPNLTMSLIFTTRLSLSQIDSALLDRIDHVLPFPRPGPSEALHYLLYNFLEILGDFFPDEASTSAAKSASGDSSVRSHISRLRDDRALQSELLQAVLLGDTWKVCRPFFLGDNISYGGRSNSNEQEDGPIRDDVSVLSTTSSTASARRQSSRIQKLSSNTVSLGGEHDADDRPEESHRPAKTALSSNRDFNTNTTASLFSSYQRSNKKYTSGIQQFLMEHHSDLLPSATLRSSFSLASCLQLMILHACRLPILQASSGSNSTRRSRNVSTTSRDNLVVSSPSWSYRDFHKKLMNIRYAALCSETCTITNHTWLSELLQSE